MEQQSLRPRRSHVQILETTFPSSGVMLHTSTLPRSYLAGYLCTELLLLLIFPWLSGNFYTLEGLKEFPFYSWWNLVCLSKSFALLFVQTIFNILNSYSCHFLLSLDFRRTNYLILQFSVDLELCTRSRSNNVWQVLYLLTFYVSIPLS